MAETKTIAVLSGKGGTGKTFVSVNLANVLQNCAYVDCDVEEPNGRLFLKPSVLTSCEVAVNVPVFDNSKCSRCRACVDFCRFNALCITGNGVTLFDKVCHSCGGCALVCRYGAISERQKVIGKIETGKSKSIDVFIGTLNEAETSGIPVIEELLKISETKPVRIIDCPPGSACAVQKTVSAADYLLIVAEPTIYGAQNLDMIYRLALAANKKCGIVLNKCTDSENPSEEYARKNDIPVFGHIPYSQTIASVSAKAELITDTNDELKKLFYSLAEYVLREVQNV